MLQEHIPYFWEEESDKIFTVVNDLLDGYLEFVIFENIEPSKKSGKEPEDPQKYGYYYINAKEYKAIQDKRKNEKKERNKLRKENGNVSDEDWS